MKIMTGLVVLFVLLTLSPAHAVEYRSYKIIADILGDEVNEELVITLLNDGPSALATGTVSVPLGSEILSVRDSYGALDYTTSIERGIKIDFSFGIPVREGEERLVIIKLRTKSLVTKKEGYFEYLLVLTPKTDIPMFEHVLRLPKDAGLYSPRESFSLVVPETNVSIEDGTVLWRVELKANIPEVFLARYRTDSGGPWKNAAYILLAVGALSALGIFGKRARSAQKKKKTIDSLGILNERERQVLEEIVNNEGIKQYELLEKLGYTKASLSKILAKLEARRLVEKKRHGKVNRLFPGEGLK